VQQPRTMITYAVRRKVVKLDVVELCKFDQRNRHLILLTKTAEMIRAKVFVGLVLTSAVMAASPRATTKSNAVLAGDSNGRMLLHAH
jgi:hypothetical protein